LLASAGTFKLAVTQEKPVAPSSKPQIVGRYWEDLNHSALSGLSKHIFIVQRKLQIAAMIVCVWWLKKRKRWKLSSWVNPIIFSGSRKNIIIWTRGLPLWAPKWGEL